MMVSCGDVVGDGVGIVCGDVVGDSGEVVGDKCRVW